MTRKNAQSAERIRRVVGAVLTWVAAVNPHEPIWLQTLWLGLLVISALLADSPES
jgi:hypothetical protein